MEECISELRNLYPENESIKEYVNLLYEMKELIVVFDAIERRISLSDAVADAMLKGIQYRVDNYEQFFSPDKRAGELEWCLVRPYLSK